MGGSPSSQLLGASPLVSGSLLRTDHRVSLGLTSTGVSLRLCLPFQDRQTDESTVSLLRRERKQSCHVNVLLRLEGPRVDNKVLRILQDWDARESSRLR